MTSRRTFLAAAVASAFAPAALRATVQLQEPLLRNVEAVYDVRANGRVLEEGKDWHLTEEGLLYIHPTSVRTGERIHVGLRS